MQSRIQWGLQVPAVIPLQCYNPSCCGDLHGSGLILQPYSQGNTDIHINNCFKSIYFILWYTHFRIRPSEEKMVLLADKRAKGSLCSNDLMGDSIFISLMWGKHVLYNFSKWRGKTSKNVTFNLEA